MEQIHATCISIDGRGVVLRGSSGIGKSDLALRLIESGGQLVADDRVNVSANDGQLFATAPENLGNLLEVRGVGIVETPALGEVVVKLVVDLVPPDDVERMPEPQYTELCGIKTACVKLTPFENSTPVKIRLALTHLAP